jgi:hypothetical protein
MDLAYDTSLKIKFEVPPIRDFFIHIRNECVEHSQLAIDVLLLFGTIYLYEKTFSAMTAIKSKHRNRLQPESGLRVAVSKIHPRMGGLGSNMQNHQSHRVRSPLCVLSL